MEWLWLLPVLLPPLAFFWRGCPCCANVVDDCQDCWTGNITLVISGVASTAPTIPCEACEGLNATHSIPRTTLCNWNKSTPIASANFQCRNVVTTVALAEGSFTVGSTTYQWRWRAAIGTGTFNATYDYYTNSDPCPGTFVMDKVSQSASQGCTYPATIQLTV
jgi:hypothetical protein